MVSSSPLKMKKTSRPARLFYDAKKYKKVNVEHSLPNLPPRTYLIIRGGGSGAGLSRFTEFTGKEKMMNYCYMKVKR